MLEFIKKNRYKLALGFIVMILILCLSFGLSSTWALDTSLVTIDLNGEDVITINVGDDYVERGATVLVGGKDMTKDLIIDTSQVDVNTPGTYYVTYKYIIDNENNLYEFVTREVNVVDNESPIITLIGEENVTITLYEDYVDPGYTVNDNIDKDLHDKVIVDNKVNNQVVGDYLITYTVTDSNGNTGSVKRYVKVVDVNDKGALASSINENLYSNTVMKNRFNSTGIYLYGYFSKGGSSYKIKLENTSSGEETIALMEEVKPYYYEGNITLLNLENGIYQLYIVGNGEERLENHLGELARIVRAKIGNKLVTVNYANDEVSLTIEDFNYQYDILIDVGHGGKEIGTSNGNILEKDLNLLISKYEKCRYEEHGLSVLLTREDDNEVLMMGSSSQELNRRGYAIGYYGVVSRIAYSNHHNSTVDTSRMGYELLVQAGMPKKQLATEFDIVNGFNSIYNLTEEHDRVYARDYDSERTYSKLDGEKYSFSDYYAILRIPYQLFNTKMVIYEPTYMSNNDDFNWYYYDKNMISVSEIKIENYVKSLGKEYKSDNSKCVYLFDQGKVIFMDIFGIVAIYVLESVLLNKYNNLVYKNSTFLVWIPFMRDYFLGKFVWNNILGIVILVFNLGNFLINFKLTLFFIPGVIIDLIVAMFELLYILLLVKYLDLIKKKKLEDDKKKKEILYANMNGMENVSSNRSLSNDNVNGNDELN